MAGPEQHQLLRLKQLKFLHCSFCLALPLEADVPGAPGWSCHAWSGPRPGPPAGGLHMCPVYSSLSQEAPTSRLDQILVRMGGVESMGGSGQPDCCGILSNRRGGRQMLMRIIGIPINQVLAAHLAQLIHAWPCILSRGVWHSAFCPLTPSLPAIHVPTRGNST